MHSRVEELDCAAVEPLLEAYVDGELPDGEADAVARHLSRCPGCARERDLAIAVRDGLRDLPRWDAPGRVLEAVHRAAGRLAPAPVPSARRRSWSAVTAAAAAAVLAVAGSVLWWHQGRSRTELGPRADEATVARATAEVRYALGLIARTTREASVDAGRRALVEHVVRPVVTVFQPSHAPPGAVNPPPSAADAAKPGGSS